MNKKQRGFCRAVFFFQKAAGRFLKEKGDVRSAGLACAIFSSTLIGIYRYFIFEAPDISKRDFALILGNTFKYALMDFLSSTGR